MDLGRGIDWKLAGSNEDSAEASAFLSNAFGAAIFLIFVVLLAQFNKFTSVWLVLSCVVMATIGVLLGMLLTGQTFGIVMSGIGVIALAGVVVNNNIVLIDTYDRLREEGWDKMEAVLQTCRERARPVVLTALSAILGVLPIAFGLGLEIFHHETTINAPSTQWWISLSSAIVFGLSFATVLTLVVTPSMLMVFTALARTAASTQFFRPPVPPRPGKPPGTVVEGKPSSEPAIAYPEGGGISPAGHAPFKAHGRRTSAFKPPYRAFRRPFPVLGRRDAQGTAADLAHCCAIATPSEGSK